MNEPVVKKAYYSIGEVCELTDLKPHVLRYWETQFSALHPNKNRAGNRVYRPQEVELILLVKHLLYEDKYTIEGANRRVGEIRRQRAGSEGREQDVLSTALLAGIRGDLLKLQDTLTAPDLDVET